MGYEREKQIIRSKGIYCTSAGRFGSGGVTVDKGGLTVSSGGASIYGAVTFYDAVSFSSGVNVTYDGLGVVGESTFQGTVNITSGGMSVVGKSTFSNGVTCSSQATVTKRLTASSGMAVTGQSTFTGKITGKGGMTLSSGTLTVSVGGASITGASTFANAAVFNSGATLKGGITMTSGAFKMPLTEVTTTGTLPNWGVSRLSATTAGKNFILQAPAAGNLKFITAGSTLALTVTCAGGSYFQASTHADAAPSTAVVTATFDDGTDALTLLGLSTVRWHVVSNVGTVALS